MIRPNNAPKIGGKPPPPVPPRPSKSVVAEALAKSRQNHFKSPTRQAPPPPLTGTNEIVKSKSSYAVNVCLKKPPTFDRSISEEIKNTSRPIVYQSPKVKCTNGVTSIVNSIDNKVQIVNKDSEESIIVKRVDSFSKIANGTAKPENGVVQITRKNSAKRDSLSEENLRKRENLLAEKTQKRNSFVGDKFSEKIVNIEDTCVNKYIQEDDNFESSKSNSSTLEKSCDCSTTSSSSSSSSEKRNWDQILNDRNHVNTLIDEMFASVLEVQINDGDDDNCLENSSENSDSPSSVDATTIIIGSDGETVMAEPLTDNKVIINNRDSATSTPDVVPTTVIVIKTDSMEVENKEESSRSNSLETSKQVKFRDQSNHELLINELQCMKRDQEKILKRQRKPSMNLYDDEEAAQAKNEKVRRPETLDLSGIKKDNERFSSNMSSLQHGLPPLPKSLSGFNLSAPNHPPTPPRSTSIRTGIPASGVPSPHITYSPHSGKPPEQLGGSMKTTGLDAKLAILRQEMYSLRQLDLSLLSQLWSLNESIQDFRQMLQEQEERVLSPPSPSPTPSSGDEEFYMSATSLNFRPATTSTVRKQSTSSNASSMGG